MQSDRGSTAGSTALSGNGSVSGCILFRFSSDMQKMTIPNRSLSGENVITFIVLIVKNKFLIISRLKQKGCFKLDQVNFLFVITLIFWAYLSWILLMHPRTLPLPLRPNLRYNRRYGDETAGKTCIIYISIYIYIHLCRITNENIKGNIGKRNGSINLIYQFKWISPLNLLANIVCGI